MRELTTRAQAAQRPIHVADDGRLAQLAGTDRHQGVVAIVDAAAPHVTIDDVLETLAEPALLLVLDGVTDPHNLGACLRNADAFGAHAVIVPKDRAVGLNATVAKAASGAAETVPLVTVTNLARTLRDLKAKGVWILGADAGGENLFDADVSGPVAWVLGAEGAGCGGSRASIATASSGFRSRGTSRASTSPSRAASASTRRGVRATSEPRPAEAGPTTATSWVRLQADIGPDIPVEQPSGCLQSSYSLMSTP